MRPVYEAHLAGIAWGPPDQQGVNSMGKFEEVKGKAKQAVGDLTDDPDLRREGQAQEEKGEAESDATKARVKAKAHETKAEVMEKAEEAAQEARRH
jgi:uncharacterized protein YjbJ (UPF0337 family)